VSEAKPRILLADDSKVVRVSAQRILADEFELVLAEDGEQAFDALGKDKGIEAVFTDLGMPRLDGFGLVERLRASKDERLRAVPVIVVTANESDEARERALALGATDFITKPFNKVDLTARAKAHVEQSRKVKAAKAEARQLEQYTTIDPLTRLGNREHFTDKLRQARSFTLRHRQALSLLRLEVDQARALAQKHGQETLDLVLKEVGALVRTTVRTEDSAARIGAAQFAVVLPTCEAPGALVLAGRLARLVEAAALRHQKRGITYKVNIGIATPSDYPDLGLKEIVQLADDALKQAGGGKIVAHQPPGQEPAKPTAPPVGETPTLERALELIAAGRSDAVAPHVPVLLKRLVPLLKLATRHHAAALAAYLDKLAKGR
jgi:diguanylate cyclase (GGDEF)-like protein